MTGPLLFAYDGSRDAANAIARAGEVLAARPALVVHAYVGLSRMLLHSSVDVADTALADAAREVDAADAEAAQRIAAEGAALAVTAGFEAQPLAVEQRGKPWQTLLATAAEHHAAAIVAGARGRSAIASAVLGSVSTGIAHHSHLPVLVVPATCTQAGAGPLTLCFDDSENSRSAITQAGRLAAGHQAVVLHVWQSWAARSPSYVPLMSGDVRGMAHDLDQVAGGRSSELAAAGVAFARGAGFSARPLSACCDRAVWHAVVEVAAGEDASLVVLGSRGMTGPAAALGSVSHGVLHHAGRPVLVVPPAAAE